MRHARQTGHDPFQQRLAAGRRLGPFHAIRGLFPVALWGFRRDGLGLHDDGLHRGVEDIRQSLLCQEKIAIIVAGPAWRMGRATGGGGDEGRT